MSSYSLSQVQQAVSKKPMSGYSRERLASGAIVSAAVIGAVFLYLFPPDVYKFYPPCLFHLLTGLYCPGCGTARALFNLFHGNIARAFHYNPLAVLMVPPLGFWFLCQFRFAVTGKRWRLPLLRAKFIWLFLFIICIYWILRNMPMYPFTFLAPPP